MRNHLVIVLASLAVTFLASACVDEPSSGLYDPCTGEQVGSINVETGATQMFVDTDSAVVASSPHEAMSSAVYCPTTHSRPLTPRPEMLPRNELRDIDYWQGRDVDAVIDDNRLQVVRDNFRRENFR